MNGLSSTGAASAACPFAGGFAEAEGASSGPRRPQAERAVAARQRTNRDKAARLMALPALFVEADIEQIVWPRYPSLTDRSLHFSIRDAFP